MASVRVEVDGARELAVDMRNVEPLLARRLKPAVSKGAQNIKQDLAGKMRESRSFGVVAQAISYDLDDDGYGAEIGPEKGAPGSLANVAYFGTSRGGGTVADPEDALQEEADAFIEHLAAMAEELALG